MTAGSLTQYTTTSSTPLALRSSVSVSTTTRSGEQAGKIQGSSKFYHGERYKKLIRQLDSCHQRRTLSLKVPRDLGTGSRGCEGPGEANDDHVLILDIFGDVDSFRIGEPLEKSGRGQFVTNSDVGSSGEACVEAGGSKSSYRCGKSCQDGGSDLHGDNKSNERFMVLAPSVGICSFPFLSDGWATVQTAG